MTTTFILVAVVAVALFCTFCFLSAKTTQMVYYAIPMLYGYEVSDFDWDTFSHSEEEHYRPARRKLNTKYLLDSQDFDVLQTLPLNGKKNISAVVGEWSRTARTSHKKGATLRNFRTMSFPKKVLHPCVCGGRSECFD